jgi:hypothetical protein
MSGRRIGYLPVLSPETLNLKLKPNWGLGLRADIGAKNRVQFDGFSAHSFRKTWQSNARHTRLDDYFAESSPAAILQASPGPGCDPSVEWLSNVALSAFYVLSAFNEQDDAIPPTLISSRDNFGFQYLAVN